ncbi:MAG: hypothetical protein ACU0BS_00125 [Hasllibacter sp.]
MRATPRPTPDPIRAALAALLLAGCGGIGGGGGGLPAIDLRGRTAVEVPLPLSGRDVVLACRPAGTEGATLARAEAAAADLDAGFAAIGGRITGRFLAALDRGRAPEPAQIALIARRDEAALTRRIEADHGCVPAQPRRPAPRP